MVIYYTGNFKGGRAESRRLLAKAIAEYTGDAERAQELFSGLLTGENGKPYIDGFDHFSVSHTGGIWAVLIDKRECGLDIQLSKECDVAAIAKKIYAAEDAGRVAQAAEEDPAKAYDEFFMLWTRREALTKALGGSVYDTKLPSVSAGDPLAGQKRYRLFDIGLPDMETIGGKKLYAAVCVEDTKEVTGAEMAFQALEQRPDDR